MKNTFETLPDFRLISENVGNLLLFRENMYMFFGGLA